MLHIVTPLYRYDLLQKVYDSIPKEEDITWHIAKTDIRPRLDGEFLGDPRIKLYEINCKDSDIVAKRNAMFANIKDGYFHLLDDDTIFCPKMYEVYKRYSDFLKFKGMVIGTQNNATLTNLRLRPHYPKCAYIDTGNVICYHSVLEKVKWANVINAPRDCTFWIRCAAFFGKAGVQLIPDVISYYNALTDYEKDSKLLPNGDTNKAG